VPAEAAIVVGEIQYANTGDAYVAYQILGDGPRDLLVIMEGFIPVDTMDDEPRLARSMARLCALARLVRFDRRGIGLSDPDLVVGSGLRFTDQGDHELKGVPGSWHLFTLQD
jgi:pimeloyl-ACP methyl ester carboxylesterase